MTCIYQKLGVLLIIHAILAGCSNILNYPSKQAQTPETIQVHKVIPSHMDELMLYYDYLNKKTEEALADEYEMIKKQFMHHKSDENYIKYIMLLAFPETAFHDTDAALELLYEWSITEQYHANLSSFKNFFLMLLTEQQRLQRIIGNLSQQLKAERERATILQKRVDDIKVMEKNLIRRNAH